MKTDLTKPHEFEGSFRAKNGVPLCICGLPEDNPFHMKPTKPKLSVEERLAEQISVSVNSYISTEAEADESGVYEEYIGGAWEIFEMKKWLTKTVGKFIVKELEALMDSKIREVEGMKKQSWHPHGMVEKKDSPWVHIWEVLAILKKERPHER